VVAGEGHVGGLIGGDFWIGDSSQATTSHCCFLDPNEGGGPDNGLGQYLSAAQMAVADNFVGWDFIERTSDGIANTWSLPDGAPYPLPSALKTDLLPELEGRGTSDSPYLIRSIADFCAMSRHPSACYRLDADLDLGGARQNCPPIPLLVGHFDGGGHSITGLSLTHPCYGGLFGVVHSSASIRDLTVVDANITGMEEDYAMGILAGVNQGDITNCHVQGRVRGNKCLGGLAGVCFGPLNVSRCTAVVSIIRVPVPMAGGGYVGGLVGWSDATAYSDCCASATIAGGDRFWGAGGVAGCMCIGAISRCFTLGSISAGQEAASLGGLAGVAYEVTIRNCYAGVDITTGVKARYIAGLVANPYGGATMGGPIEYCYSRGAICVGEGSEDIQGFVAHGSTPKSCFWDAQTSGIQVSSFGTGLPTAVMQKGQTYKQAGWDFTNTWSICDGKDYPRLRWEQVECE